MFKPLSLMLCMVFALFSVGCNKSTTEGNANANARTANANRAATAANSPATSTAPATGEKIGVPECDDFIAKYESCVTSRVPEAARAQYKTSVEQWRSSWRKLAANPQTKATLAAACKSTAEQARTSMKTYNCTF